MPSPSVWRVWIEMLLSGLMAPAAIGHPPCGGCGLKSTKPHQRKPLWGGHPPCGGCGLKFRVINQVVIADIVTLRVEGVD